MPDESFEKIEVWQRSLEIAVRLHELLRDCRDFGFRQQITDSADSISATLPRAPSATRSPSSANFSAMPKVRPEKPTLDSISPSALVIFPPPRPTCFSMNCAASRA